MTVRQVRSLTFPVGLHPDTQNLVLQFAEALADKLRYSEVKYGYGNGWAEDGWMEQCRNQLSAHVYKGDPLDVAAYCAFLWYHHEPTYKWPHYDKS